MTCFFDRRGPCFDRVSNRIFILVLAFVSVLLFNIQRQDFFLLNFLIFVEQVKKINLRKTFNFFD